MSIVDGWMDVTMTTEVWQQNVFGKGRYDASEISPQHTRYRQTFPCPVLLGERLGSGQRATASYL